MNLSALLKVIEELALNFKELFRNNGNKRQLRTEKVYVRVNKPFEK